MTKTVNSFRRHGNFPNSEMDDKTADKNGQWTGELLEDSNTLVLFLLSVKRAVMQYVCVNVYLRMYLYGLNTELIDGSSKLEFQTFKIIRQFFVRLLVMPRAGDNDAPTSFQLICNARNIFYRFQTLCTLIFPKTTIIF